MTDPVARARKRLEQLRGAGEVGSSRMLRPRQDLYGRRVRWVPACPVCGHGGRGWLHGDRLRHVEHGVEVESGTLAICVL